MRQLLALRRVASRLYLHRPRPLTREELEAFSRKIQPNLLASKRRKWVEQALRYQQEVMNSPPKELRRMGYPFRGRADCPRP